jgi:cob(I)alamin adenosyltransferase
MKIYTGTGDKGKTSLFSGERIGKNDIRIEAYGVVDELNTTIGAIGASLPTGEESDTMRSQLIRIQKDLFRIGALLATTVDSPAMAHLLPMQEEDGRWLEEQVDWLQSHLPELQSFILPGGHISAAWAHVARTVCRRAERRIVSLFESDLQESAAQKNLLTYVNRLSDYLFVLARYCNHLTGVDDQTWMG